MQKFEKVRLKSEMNLALVPGSAPGLLGGHRRRVAGAAGVYRCRSTVVLARVTRVLAPCVRLGGVRHG